jgi:hypothetical protein
MEAMMESPKTASQKENTSNALKRERVLQAVG